MKKGQLTGVICSKTNHPIKIGDKVVVKTLFDYHSDKTQYEVVYGKCLLITDDWGVKHYAYCPHIKWEDGSGGLAITEENIYWAGE